MKDFKNTIDVKNIIMIVLGLALGIFISFIFIGFTDKTLNVLKAISIIFVGLSLLLALWQYNNSNRWNKKQLAANRLHESGKSLKACISVLHDTLNIIERDSSIPYEVHELHNAFGVFDKDENFIFHGEEKESDIKNLPLDSKQKEKHINSFRDINGREIKDNVIALLNEYEYIALNVNNDIFDFETVKRLMAGKIIKNYNRFAIYINHLREHHKYGKNIYIEFEQLSKKLELMQKS